jgi:type II secretory pathway pseudopilin PulG
MAARVRLSTQDLSVQPGSEVVVDCFVTNAGRVVDEFHVTVLGDAARWAETGPPLRLMPGQEGVTSVVFRPPRAAATSAQAIVFGLQVTSTQDPAGVAVEEALLNVQPFSDASAELIPATSHGARAGRHEIAIDNRGNQRLAAALAASDQAGALRFRFRPPAATIGPGSAAFAQLLVAPRKRFWRGTPKTHPFEVTVRPQHQESAIVLQGAMVQEAVLPRWLPAALLALLALLAVLGVAWLGLLRPAVMSAARQAVQQPLAEQAAAFKDGQKQVDDVKAQQQAQGDAISKLTGQPPPTPTPTPGVSPLGDPTDGRLSGNATFTIPDKDTLSITDLVIENPNDDSGTLRVQRDGRDLLVLKLDNFRDLDYHFVTPITMTSGQRLQLVCQPASGTTTCGGSIYYTGFMKTPPPT